jgi:hypothetical protein
MMIQLVPSLTSVAYLPAVAARIPVPAAPPASGTTLEEAETTVNAAIVLSMISRPVQALAVGNVTVIEAAPLQINQFSAMPTVKALVFVTGELRPIAPVYAAKPLLFTRSRSVPAVAIPKVFAAGAKTPLARSPANVILGAPAVPAVWVTVKPVEALML